MEQRKVTVAALAVVDVLVLLAGALVSVTRHSRFTPGPGTLTRLTASSASKVDLGPIPRPQAVGAGAVAGRPDPANHVTPTGPWPASLQGSGQRVAIYAPATVSGFGTVSIQLPTTTGTAGTAIALPDGSRWYPQAGPVRLDGVGGDLLLNGASLSTEAGPVTGLLPDGDAGGLLGRGGVTATGSFAQRDGATATSLALPAGTRFTADCPTGDPTQPPPPCPTTTATTAVSLTVSVGTTGATRLTVDTPATGHDPRFAGQGEGGYEIEVAGSARAEALGTTWDGLTGSLEADDLEADVAQQDGGWVVKATAGSARQVWIDVWPVADTTLTASGGYDGGSHSCVRECSVRLRYKNTGYATAQIFEAEGVGGSNSVSLGVKQTGTHDAGLGVHRGGREINLASGKGIDSHVPPGASNDRGLTTTAGVGVTIVLRGNLPEVRAALPTLSAAGA